MSKPSLGPSRSGSVGQCLPAGEDQVDQMVTHNPGLCRWNALVQPGDGCVYCQAQGPRCAPDVIRSQIQQYVLLYRGWLIRTWAARIVDANHAWLPIRVSVAIAHPAVTARFALVASPVDV
jgi:hypothetical protein